jgi:peptide/nickel transport system permease protein
VSTTPQANLGDARSRGRVGNVFLSSLRGETQLWVGLGVATSVGLLALLAPVIAPYPPETSVGAPLEAPSADHLFGTDSIGFDILSRILWGARLDLGIALGAAALSFLVGVLLGTWFGYVDGPLSTAIARLSDTIQSFPVFVVAVAIVAATGNKLTNVIYVVAFVNAPIFFRLARTETRVLRHAGFVDSAVVSGASRLRVIRQHIFPNAIGPLLAQASMTAGWALLLASGLSFVGAGVRPPAPEWGAMIATGSENVLGGQWWPTVFPGVAILVTVMAFALISESITARVRGGDR